MRCALLLAATVLAASAARADERPIRVGSKKFTESVILGEAMAQLVARAGHATEHKAQLGGSRILFEALRGGDLDAYPEYTGTLLREILAREGLPSWEAAAGHLAELGITATAPLGFDNTYALGMRAPRAEELGIRTIGDLARHRALHLAFSNEFLQRADGWPGLARHYGLTHEHVRGMDHDMAYRGLRSAEVDVMDLYSTDAEIVQYGLRALEDDRHYFPSYQAVILYRSALRESAPRAADALESLAGRVSAERMRRMNAAVKVEGRQEAEVAADLLRESVGGAFHVQTATRAQRIWQRTREHLVLVLLSLLGVMALGIGLGVLAAKRPWLGPPVLAIVGLIWTVPALGLFYVMIPWVGLYERAAITALLLYGLLPVVRNTWLGLTTIPPAVSESASVLGLRGWRRLWHVELPMAAPSIFAGAKTAVVITVGTATIGAIIGAGGYGQPILTGIRRDDMGMVLEGSLPAMGMALALLLAADRLERWIVSPGLRRDAGG